MRNLRSLIVFFIFIGLLIALAVSPALAQPAFDPPGLERAIEVQKQHTDALLDIRGVVGTAVGLGADGEAVVKIYTERSGIGGLPRSLDGVPVVVQVTGRIFAFHHRSDHCDGPPGSTLPPGCSEEPANNPPEVSITSPSDGDPFTSGTSISFAGTAIDQEEGNLTASLNWVSSIDGQIGSGENFTNTTLSDGNHTITASVTDSGGATGSDQITVTVGNVVDPKASFPWPVPIGVSSGSERLVLSKGRLFCFVGTLGVRVTDGTKVYALSNNHVYALEGVGVLDDWILQPGRVDMTDQACGSLQEINNSVIGNLSAFVPIEFSRRASNTVDAAIATVTVQAVGNTTPSDGYGAPASASLECTDPTSPDIDCGNLLQTPRLAVQKYGRTTGLTTGTITDVNASVIIRYDSGQARFNGQIVVTGDNGTFSDSGDSGSLIVTISGNNPVALLFAGSSSVTIGNPIDEVLNKLSTELGETLAIDGP